MELKLEPCVWNVHFFCVVYAWLTSSKVKDLGGGVCTLPMMMN